MKYPKLAVLSLALAAAFPLAHAAEPNDALLKELQALKARMADLEQKLQAQEAKLQQASANQGMTAEQQAAFNRIALKTEELEDSREVLGFKGLKVTGYMDPTYLYNQRQNRAGFQFLNSVADGGYSFNNSYMGTVALDFLKETDNGTRWHLTLSPQRSSQAVVESSNSIVQEASVSVPLGDLQTRLIAGHLPDWSGYEMQQPTLNKLITHNLLFDTTLPTAYTGAGLELTRDEWIVKGVLANMNASRRNTNEKTPVFAYRADYAKSEFAGIGFAGVHGKAPNANAGMDTRIDLFEVDGYFNRGPWTFQGQFGIGRQAQASITPDPITGELRDARWAGLSGLVAYKFQPRLEGVVRLDHIRNRANGGGLLTYSSADAINGIGPAMAFDGTSWGVADPEKGVNRTALSFGLNYNYSQNVLLKAEYRLDAASGPVFLDYRTGDYKKTNQTLGAAVVVSF